jgi:hypothetical protein
MDRMRTDPRWIICEFVSRSRLILLRDGFNAGGIDTHALGGGSYIDLVAGGLQGLAHPEAQ